MKLIVMFTACMLWLKCHLCAPTWKKMDPQINLKSLSEIGEKYVDEEMKKALIGIKQMKTMMERNEEKHKELMKTLKKSGKEKKETQRLVDEIKERLEEEERRCQMSLMASWDECKSCLESICMRFYTTCQPSWSSVIDKVEKFFKKIPPIIFPLREVQGRDAPSSGNLEEEEEEEEDVQFTKMEDQFGQLSLDISSLFERSTDFFRQIQQEFDLTFQSYFLSDTEVTKPATSEAPKRNVGFLKNWEIPNLFQLIFDFSRSIFEGVSEVMTETLNRLQETIKDLSEQAKVKRKMLMVLTPVRSESDPENLDQRGVLTELSPGHNRALCGQLQRNSSKCLQFNERCQKCQNNLLKECPGVPELHVNFDDAFRLANVSKHQFAEIFQVVEHHMEDTVYLMGKLRERFGWVSELSNRTVRSENIFNVAPRNQVENSADPNDTEVEVNILTSPTLTIRVPDELSPEDSAFIEYVAEEALRHYKQNF
ncbi:clusterin-like protein 1 [Tachyglossus aculeatus]|uniref:clusterin-like protein 1 n=1 Tax=Tachyglossus aculeatus TaxID=9261 RepID=UPI0018F2808E|nr:clusterin-like protein 1 [Tachyglossus aculeatus]